MCCQRCEDGTLYRLQPNGELESGEFQQWTMTLSISLVLPLEYDDSDDRPNGADRHQNVNDGPSSLVRFRQRAGYAIHDLEGDEGDDSHGYDLEHGFPDSLHSWALQFDFAHRVNVARSRGHDVNEEHVYRYDSDTFPQPLESQLFISSCW